MPLKNFKTCVITGANAGIGKAAAAQIAAKGYHVILACRNRQRGKAALQELKQLSGNSVELLELDMSLCSSIKAFVGKLEGRSIDVLIHNAAQFDISQKHPVLTGEGVESIWATNYIGVVYLTSLLLDSLKKAEQARVITVASKGLLLHPNLQIDFTDPEFKKKKFGVAKAYYQSKLAQVMYTYWLAEHLKASTISVNCVRVTNVAIDISRYPNVSKLNKFLYSLKSKFSISPEQMAQTYTFLATSNEAKAYTGQYFDESNKKLSSSVFSRKLEAIAQLIELTKRYLPKGLELV